jgi:hypothetical protein
MDQSKQDENGGYLRQELILKTGNNNKGRNMTATIVWTPISDERAARIDAEVEKLLAELARGFCMTGEENESSRPL